MYLKKLITTILRLFLGTLLKVNHLVLLQVFVF